MSGIEFYIHNMGDDFGNLVDRAHGTVSELARRRRVKKDTRERVRAVAADIERSHDAMMQSVMDGLGDEVEQMAANHRQNLVRVRNDLAILNGDLEEVRKAISETEETIRGTDERMRQDLYETLDRYREEQRKMEEQRERLNKEVEQEKAAIHGILDKAADEVRLNNENLVNEVVSRSDTLRERIERNMPLDSYCEFAYSAALEVLKDTLSLHKNVADYDYVMDDLEEISRWLDEADRAADLALRSRAAMELVVSKLRGAFQDDYKVTLSGSYTSIATVVVEFPDCVSEIKMRPDGEGGFNIDIINHIDPKYDAETHENICHEHCDIIGKALDADLNYEESVLRGGDLEEAERRSRIPANEVANNTVDRLRERVRDLA